MAASPSNNSDIKCFNPILEAVGLALDASQLQLLLRHLDLLLLWNKKINLTSVRTPAEILRRHFGESLFLAAHLGFESGTLVDIGSGAGFPGFPVAVAKPGVTVTLVESVGKKAAFLKEVSREVGNARVLHGRFEDSEATFDWATIRGVELNRLLDSICLKCKGLSALVGKDQVAALATDPRLDYCEPVPLPWYPDRILVSASVRLHGKNSPKCFT